MILYEQLFLSTKEQIATHNAYTMLHSLPSTEVHKNRVIDFTLLHRDLHSIDSDK